ncbi:MAG: hypothetical protein GXO27_07625 [Chlorobi bacterium]|nr:hypothetical protein [Chlorobiota bacterium]
MKKWLYLLLAMTFALSACKKEGGEETGGEDEEVYECLPEQIEYVDHQDPNDNENIRYYYVKNAIDRKTRNLAGGSSYTYQYVYEDIDKGLLDRIDIYNANSELVAKVEYTLNNELIASRELLLYYNNRWYSAWLVEYFYNNDNKVERVRIRDYDLWNNGQNPTDETGIYTYTGDNVTRIQWYDTDDMQTLKEEYLYEYDNGKRAFSNVVTQTYPTTRVNNIIRAIRNVYGTSPTSEETLISIDYNNKGFPVNYEAVTDRGAPVYSQTITYLNCE